MSRKLHLLLIFLCFSALSTFAQNKDSKVTLKQLLDSALQSNHLLQAHKNEKQINQSEIELLKATYLPKIGTYASFSYWDWLMPNKKRILGSGSTDMYTELSAYQRVYDWGVTKTKQSVIENTIALNAETEREIRHSIIWGVNNAYIELLKSKAQTEVYQNSIKQLEAQLRFTDNLYQIGKASQVDLLRIKVKLSTEEKHLQQSLNAEDAQITILKNMCFLEETNGFQVDTSAMVVAQKQIGNSFIVDTLYRQLLLQHPILKSSDIKLEQEAKQKELYRLANRPEMFSFATTTWEDGYIPFGNNFNYNVGVGIRYTIPFLGGKGHKTKMLQSDFKATKIQEEKHQFETDLKGEIDVALNQWKTLQDELVKIKSIIHLSDEALHNATVQYEGGQGSLIDVLDAQTVLTDAEINYKQNTIALLQVLARLHYLSGNDSYPFNF
ncbi:TolC family protein [Puteibacter caeruleilacunae]|nr:TolC family protein [Puteibacter caeruleilacunae]